MTRVKFGIIGCGTVAQEHLREASGSTRVEILAIASRREHAARDMAKTFGVPRAYQGAERLLADPDVEAVILALPAGPRALVALQALKSGKHVLLEKPAALNSGEIGQLIEARGKLA